MGATEPAVREWKPTERACGVTSEPASPHTGVADATDFCTKSRAERELPEDPSLRTPGSAPER